MKQVIYMAGNTTDLLIHGKGYIPIEEHVGSYVIRNEEGDLKHFSRCLFRDTSDNELPQLGIELDGFKVLSGNGVKEWHNKPIWKVVGHHINGEQFFAEHTGDNSLTVFKVDCNQWRYLKNNSEEIEAIKQEMRKLANRLEELQ